VFTNLLVNAQHALESAPRPRRVSIETRPAVDGGVEVEIADNGPGVPASLRARVFDPFFTTKPQGSGTGIGLSVCHGIVTGHGGDIVLDEPDGGGARFTVSLPLGTAAGDDDEPSTDTDAAFGTARLLVVDDEEEIAEMLAEALERRGYEVTIAGDGESALRELEHRRFDVMVTDLRMPGLDGGELLARVDALHPAMRPALIVLTGDTLGPRPEYPVAPGVHVLDKPVDLRQLLRAVRDQLAPR